MSATRRAGGRIRREYETAAAVADLGIGAVALAADYEVLGDGAQAAATGANATKDVTFNC